MPDDLDGPDSADEAVEEPAHKDSPVNPSLAAGSTVEPAVAKVNETVKDAREPDASTTEEETAHLRPSTSQAEQQPQNSGGSSDRQGMDMCETGTLIRNC